MTACTPIWTMPTPYRPRGQVGIAPAIPLVAMGISSLLKLFFGRKGPQQKVATTKMVEQVQPLMEANLADYMAGPRTRGSQAAHLANFDQLWAWLTSSEVCGNPEMGDPGKRCISERNRGGKYDWFVPLRDPIANDTDVKDDPVADLLAPLGNTDTVIPLMGIGLVVLGAVL
jgi:hypothetical protein